MLLTEKSVSISGGATSNDNVNIGEINGNIKLPTMQLPTFNGDYEQWEHFRDMFSSLVHQDAATVIKLISVTNDIYLVA